MNKSSCVYLEANNSYLMLLRNKKKNDVNEGKWIGIGGKLEKNETIEECAKREVKEETGLTINQLNYRGLLRFYYPNSDELVYIYTSNDFSGDLHENDEGSMEWISKEDILSLNLWEGDKVFLKRLLEDDNKVFDLELHYDNTGCLLEVVDKEVVK